MYEYKATIERTIDGDTFVCMIDLGFSVFKNAHIRLKDANAPEIRGAEREEGLKVKSYVEQLFLKHDNQVIIRTSYSRSFARWVGEIYLGEINLAEHLVSEGYAVWI